MGVAGHLAATAEERLSPTEQKDGSHMALGGAALVAAWLGAAASAPATAPAPAPVHQTIDAARFQAQVEALTAESPSTRTPTYGLIDRAATSVRARLAAAEALLRRVGLDPQRFTGRSTGLGGPFIPAGTTSPSFQTLTSTQQVEALEATIAAIPSYVPVKAYSFTSPYGVRYDPFNGRSAMHAGLDMAGKTGEPIYAAADGTVVTGGKSGAYGNLVEIDHGKGLATRYGHLSAILVQPGTHVRQGQLIARMGSTGRSTGTHLHYEIRLDGRAINPRPFLDASSFMLAAQGRSVEGPSLAATLLDDVNVTFTLPGIARSLTSN